MLALIPAAKSGHIGMYRNEETLSLWNTTAAADDIAEREVIVLGPRCRHRRQRRRRHHANQKRGAKSIKLASSPRPSMQRLQEAHSDVDIYVAAMDEKLNENGYRAGSRRWATAFSAQNKRSLRDAGMNAL